MSVTWVLVAISCIGLIAVVLAAALLSPVVVTFDSASRKVRIRWLAMVDYLLPLPAAAGRSRLSIAGKPIGLPTRQAGKKAQQPEGAARKSRRLRRRLRRFLYRCLRDSTIRRVLLKQLVDMETTLAIGRSHPAANRCVSGRSRLEWNAGGCARSNRVGPQIGTQGKLR